MHQQRAQESEQFLLSVERMARRPDTQILPTARMYRPVCVSGLGRGQAPQPLDVGGIYRHLGDAPPAHSYLPRGISIKGSCELSICTGLTGLAGWAAVLLHNSTAVYVANAGS
eukprot:jgi/Chrzof1/3824/Cz13g10050.t1